MKGRGQKKEKANNFKLAISKLIHNLKDFKFLIIISLILATIGAVMSIIGPNKLSDLTDEVSKGLVINYENLEELSKVIPSNVMSGNTSDLEFKGHTITYKDEVKFLEILSTIEGKDDKLVYNKLDKMPDSIKEVIKPTMNMDKIYSLGIFLISLYVISALFNLFQGLIMADVSNKFAKSLRSRISNKINKLPLKYFDSRQIGDILSRITNDVDTIAQSMNQSLSTLVGAITLFIGSIIMMFVTNYIMAIAAIVSSLFGFIFMFIVLSKSQKYFSLRQKELGKLNSHIEEIYSSHNVVKVYNGYTSSKEKFDKLNKSVYDCNRKSQFLSGLMPPMMGFIGNFSYVVVCVVGAYLVLNNTITFGVIVAFILYVRLFTSPLSQIAQGLTSLQSTAAASERVFEFIEETEMEDESKLKNDLKDIKGNVTFDHVKFGYDDNKVIIKDFNLNVKAGSSVAIVGPTGAGKTTLVNLLMKFYKVNSGDIKIDGISVNSLTRENIHDLFIMVLQDTWVFNGTIRDNVKYNSDASDEEIWDALKTVGVDHFVKSLPGGLDYVVTDNDSISQGQKQLLTIARARLKDSPLLILDEATSSVDTRTEELVSKAMDKLMHGRTSFVIAHRLSTIKTADIILVMRDGDIVESGNHEELMNKNGFYAELYNSQFEN